MSDFKNMLINDVTFVYPKLNSAYQYNSVEKRSDQCSEDTPGAYWSCGFTLPKPEAIKLWNAAKDHFNECKSRNSKLGDFKTIHSYKENEDDTITFGTKKNCKTSKGKPNRPIPVVDKDKKPLEDRAFWSGSTGAIKFSMLPTFNPSKNEWGISFLLDAVQVKHAEYADISEDFGIMSDDTPKDSGDAPFGQSKETVIFGDQETTVTTENKDNKSDFFDDEIPF